MSKIEIHCCASEKSTMSFPMGALCIKTAIDAHPNLPRTILKEHLLSSDPIAEADECARRSPYAVGLSMYIWNSVWFKDFAKRLKEKAPNVMVFAGGPHTVDFIGDFPDYLDFATLGEGEISTCAALLSVQEGRKPQNLQMDGVLTRHYTPVLNSPLPDLSKLASPFLTMEAEECLLGYDSVLWELTRGCPFACAFCFEGRGRRVVRDYPLNRIEKELDYLIRKEIHSVFVLDPTFNLNPERAKTILKLLLDKAPDDMHFTFEIRAELVDEEMAELFSRLNCSLQIGLQSSDEEVIRLAGRKFDRPLFEQKVRLLSERGIAFGLDIIIGLPKDNLKRFKNTVNFAVSLKPSNIDCFLLSLLPGTEVAAKAGEYGLVPGPDAERTIVSTQSFGEADIKKALRIRRGMDLFYTKGRSDMWIHCILEALGITACNLFSLFVQWMEQTGRTEEEDIWILQDDFVATLFEKTRNSRLLPAIRSFMELHQGLCYVTDTGEPAELELSYKPEDLAALDGTGLSEFVRTHRLHHCTPTVVMEDDGVKIY